MIFMSLISLVDTFLSRVSLPNFGVNTGPLVRSMNFDALNYFDPIISFPESATSDCNFGFDDLLELTVHLL